MAQENPQQLQLTREFINGVLQALTPEQTAVVRHLLEMQTAQRRRLEAIIQELQEAHAIQLADLRDELAARPAPEPERPKLDLEAQLIADTAAKFAAQQPPPPAPEPQLPANFDQMVAAVATQAARNEVAALVPQAVELALRQIREQMAQGVSLQATHVPPATAQPPLAVAPAPGPTSAPVFPFYNPHANTIGQLPQVWPMQGWRR